MPLQSVFHGVQDCRLPGFKPSKRFRRPFQGKTAVCAASNPPNAAAGLQGHCGNISCDHAVIQVEEREVQAPTLEFGSQGCRAAAKSSGPKGSPCCTPELERSTDFPKCRSEGCLCIAPVDPSGQGWEAGRRTGQDGLAVYGVEGVLEVYLQQGSFGAAARVALKPCPSRVDSSFSAGRHSDSDLGWKEMLSGSGADLCRKALPVSRRSSSPIAISRTPPFGLGTATRLAPANAGAAAAQARPWARRLTTAVSELLQPFAAPGKKASRRCCARRPEGPGAVAAGKVCNALRTSSGESSGATGSSWAATGGGEACVGCKL